MNRTLQFIGTEFILILIFGSLIFSVVGCSMIDHPPARKAYVVVEKPPFRIMYVNDVNKIDDKSVAQILKATRGYNYKNYKFNKEIMSANINVSSYQSDHESDSDMRSRTLKTEIK